MKRIFGFLCGFLLLSALVFAQDLPSRSSPQDTKALAAFNKAKDYFERGEDPLAMTALQDFLNRYPDNPLADEAYYLLGQTYSRQMDYKNAIETYRTSLQVFANSSLRSPIRHALADAYFAVGNLESALPLFEIELELAKTEEERLLLQERLLEIYIRNRSYLKAIQNLLNEARLVNEPEQQEALTNQIRNIMDQGLSEKDLLQIVENFPRRFPSDVASIKLIEMYESYNDGYREEKVLRQFLKDFPNHEYREKARTLQVTLRNQLKSKRFIVGTLLPLTGSLSPFATSVLNGLQLALDRGREEGGEGGVGLSVIDTAGAEAKLKGGMEELIREYNPIAIVGPVLSKEVKTLIPLAERYEIPIITPAATLADLSRLSHFLFRNTLTNSLQARVIARYAMAQLGLKRFVILHPNDPYGTDLAQLFAREIEQQGGELIYREAYPPQDTDFRDLIRHLKEVDLQHYGTEEEPETPATQKGNRVSITLEKIYHPGFDAIFLPGSAQQGGLLAPQLAFYNVVGVTLLGSNGWNSEDLVKIGGQFVAGTIFVDSFFVDHTDPLVKEFVQRYRVRFQQEPDMFSAQAYDSGRMILKALETGANSGMRMRDALSGIRDFPGVSGRTTVNPEGDMEKQLVFLTVRGGKITQLR